MYAIRSYYGVGAGELLLEHARGDLVPRGRDADLRLREFLVTETDGAQHASYNFV